jgi:GNAT superfamily N-acetyltransferase
MFPGFTSESGRRYDLTVEHIIRQYSLESGALEAQYIEEYFTEFRNKKTAEEIVNRLKEREHLILLSMAEDDEGVLIPVAYKIGHELRTQETNIQLAELVGELRDVVEFSNRKIFYSWIGGTREEWRGQGRYRALTEQQEEWAHAHGFHELVVKTKNRFYGMRATLDHLNFDVIKFQRHLRDNRESKVYLSKKIAAEVLNQHQTSRSVVEAA